MTEDLSRLTPALADRYRIERELGQGGMATVYLAEDLKHHRQVAVKVLRPELAAALGPERFLREIETTAALHHPHILPLYDSGEADGFLYYVMPYMEGESLRDRLDREKQLPLDDALRISREVADALSYAHARGVIHRDVKPENILLESGHAVVADFGIAKAVVAAGAETLTQTGMAIGTPKYMSPEQAAGEKDIDGRSDLYSLACVLYEMLTGQPPFTGPTVESVVRQHMLDQARPVSQLRPAVPPAIADVLTRALSKNPADRFSPAAHFAAALVTPASGRRAGASPRISRAVIGLGVAGVVTAIAAIVLVTRHRQASDVPSTGAVSSAPSIAVLPFTNLSGDSTDAYFSDGISEEILNALTPLAGLVVRGRSSSFRFRDRNPDLRAVAKELDVGTILTGSVQHLGSSVRVTVELQDVGRNVQLWSQHYDQEAKDLFALEDSISRAVVGALQVQLTDAAGQSLVAPATSNPEAHRLYFQATALSHRSDEASLSQAVSLFHEALTLDPKYAEAWAALAGTYWNLADAYRAPRDVIPLMKEAARHAVALDDALADGHLQLGTVAGTYEWDFVTAPREFQRALELNPRSPDAHYQYGVYLLDVERDVAGARSQLVQAETLDPLNPWYVLWESWAALAERDYPSALARAERVLKIDPEFFYLDDPLANVYAAARRWRECLERYAALPTAIQSLPNYQQAVCYAYSGDRTRARSIMSRLEAEADTHYVDATNIARIAVALGMRDTAFAWLGRAYLDDSASLTALWWWLDWDPLRADPRFIALAKRIGFPWAVRSEGKQ